MPGGELNIARRCTRSGTSDRSLSSVLTNHTLGSDAHWKRDSTRQRTCLMRKLALLLRLVRVLDKKASFAVEVSSHAHELNES